MKKFNKLIALLLTLVLVLGMLPMVSFAADGEDADNALVLDKTYDPETGLLTLEAFATGKSVTTITETQVPCDIVLVLDVSGSMEDDYTGASGYVPTTQNFTVRNINNDTWYYFDGSKYYRVMSEQIQDEEPTVSKASSSLQCRDVTTTETSSWKLYKDGNTQYYCKVGNEYKEIYYKMDRSGLTRYYCFAYLDSNGKYVPLFGTTAANSSGGLAGSSYIGYNYDLYTMTRGSHYNLYYVNGSNQKVYIGNSVTANNVTAYSDTLYKFATISGSKMDALKLAVGGFVDTVAANAVGADGIAGTDDDVDHKISIVKFAGDYYGSESSLAEGNHIDSGWFGDGNYTEVVKNLTSVDENGVAALKTAVNGLREEGATAADYGMTKASYVLAEPNARADSNKIVVLFTDGEPNHSSDFSSTVANATITKSKALKDAGVTVFSIGLFPRNVDSNTINYMEGVSSDYPNATAYNKLGTRADTGYFIDASGDNIDLRDVFKTVAEQSIEGGAGIELTQSSILRDIISKYFDLPEGADANSITAHSETFRNGQWTANDDGDSYTISIEEDRKTINVEGFEYSKYYVDESNEVNVNGEYGRKIVVQIPIVMNVTAVIEDGYLVDDPAAKIPTNEGTSAIYDDTDGDPETPPEVIEVFPIPDAEIDTFTVVHCGDTTGADKHTSERYAVCDSFDLTEIVNEGTLYGGTFTDKDCTVPASEDATAFAPKAGETYYMWEVSKEHLLPKNLCAYRPNDDDKYFVEDVYLVTAIDRKYYGEVGFMISGKGSAGKNVDVIARQSTIYNTITAKQAGVNVGVTTYYGLYKNSNPSPSTTANSLVACYHFSDLMGREFYRFNSSSDQFKFQPYWVTLDGVRVINDSVIRNAYYQGDGYTSLKVSDTDWMNSYIVPNQYKASPAKLSAPLQLMNSFVYGQEAEDVQEVLPVEAPEQKEEPAPFVPVKPAAFEKVTVYDGAKTYEARIAAGSVSLKPEGAEGKVFAGWYTDAAYTKPAKLSAVTDGMELYAKYVSSAYLNVKYTDSILTKKLNLISALDSTDYVQTGFIIDAGGSRQAVTVSSYTNSYLLSNAKTLFGSTVAKGSPLMVYTYSLSGLRKNASIKVTPYWITADGTVVYGDERVLTYTGFSIKG